jgi:hypothetical protein
MNFIESIERLLARHREARNWTDKGVAASLVAELGLDPEAHNEHATGVPLPEVVTEDQVKASHDAIDNAIAVHRKLEAALASQRAPAVAAADAQRLEVETAQIAEATRAATQRAAVSDEDRKAIDDAAAERVKADNAEADRLREQLEADQKALDERLKGERAARDADAERVRLAQGVAGEPIGGPVAARAEADRVEAQRQRDDAAIA